MLLVPMARSTIHFLKVATSTLAQSLAVVIVKCMQNMLVKQKPQVHVASILAKNTLASCKTSCSQDLNKLIYSNI